MSHSRVGVPRGSEEAPRSSFLRHTGGLVLKTLSTQGDPGPRDSATLSDQVNRDPCILNKFRFIASLVCRVVTRATSVPLWEPMNKETKYSPRYRPRVNNCVFIRDVISPGTCL